MLMKQEYTQKSMTILEHSIRATGNNLILEL